MNERIVVCGAGGYVGKRLVAALVASGQKDIVAHYSRSPRLGMIPTDAVDVSWGDLRDPRTCEAVVHEARWVFNLAASVGGIGFVTSETSKCLGNVTINANLVEASAKAGVQRYFFASSSCVYPGYLPQHPLARVPLHESHAWPADPMGGYGLEKLFSEQLCLAYEKERKLPVSIARYHGIYGPGDVRSAGKDHVATALAKKVIQAKLSGVHEIAIWGDGSQTRSFLFIDDCVEGTIRLMERGVSGPVNLAHPEPASVNQLVDVLEEIAAVKLTRFYQPDAPTGRQHKTSDNTLLRKSLNWEPETSLLDGMRALYNELWDQAIRA